MKRAHILALYLFVIQLVPRLAFAVEIPNLADQMEVVSLQAKEIPSLSNVSRKAISVYALGDEGLQLIPWQLDQIDEHGLVILDREKDKVISLPEQISPRDQFLWMASDMGRKAKPHEERSWPKASQWLEIEMKNKSGASGWVYLRLSLQESPISPVDYIRYEPEKDQVISPFYVLGFHDPIMANRFTWKNPDSTEGSNLLSYISIRFRARVLGIFPMKITEHDFTNTIIGYKDGPIRVVKRIQSVPHLPLGFRGQPQIVEYYFSRHVFENEVKIKIPSQGKILLANARFTMSLRVAFRPQKVFLRIPGDREFAIDPMLPSGDYVLQKDPPSWVHFSSEHVPYGFITYIQFPEKEKEVFLPQALLYHQAKSFKGGMGTLSCEIKQILKRGDHSFSMHLFTLPSSPQDLPASQAAAAIERILQDPYRVESAKLLDETSTLRN